MDSNGTAQRVEGGYRVSARKPFASGSPLGNILVTSAAFDDGSGSPEVLHFPVSMSLEGISILEDWKAMGMRSTGSHTVVLSDVFVPDEAVALRRPRGKFHPVWNTVIAVAMPLIMSVYVGLAESAAMKAQNLAVKRRADPSVPFLLGEMYNALTAAQLAVDDMVRLVANLEFTPSTELSSRMLTRKTLAATQVIRTAEKALELAGGAGFYCSAGLERLLRDAHAAQYHPLPEKRQQAFTGRVLMGLDPVSDA
jgi:acyl-CoA dehydrogenase